MTDHLSATTLSALADGELPAQETAAARIHLDTCLPCASTLVDTWLLKGSIGKSGHRYSISAAAEERLQKLIADKPGSPAAPRTASARASRNWPALSGWLAAAAMLVVLLGWTVVQFGGHRAGESQDAVVTAEASDLHIAMLASNAPQVVSSDRHTVKPWFQGKLPFSFNLPETLPADTHLDGANLAYLGDRPVAQLLFSIGRHRASIIIEQRTRTTHPIESDRLGFHVLEFTTSDLEVIAISDADRSRLSALADAMRAAQAP